ncbi:unnamed protein product [Amoebophrya sp. A120]|nr:unnamed protein product [Amoebophrya sp. A120]|eukprot:GSA120T00002506001.1
MLSTTEDEPQGRGPNYENLRQSEEVLQESEDRNAPSASATPVTPQNLPPVILPHEQFLAGASAAQLLDHETRQKKQLQSDYLDLQTAFNSLLGYTRHIALQLTGKIDRVFVVGSESRVDKAIKKVENEAEDVEGSGALAIAPLESSLSRLVFRGPHPPDHVLQESVRRFLVQELHVVGLEPARVMQSSNSMTPPVVPSPLAQQQRDLLRDCVEDTEELMARSGRRFSEGLKTFTTVADAAQKTARAADRELDKARREKALAANEAAREALRASELELKLSATVGQHAKELEALQQSVQKLDATAAHSVEERVKDGTKTNEMLLEKQFSDKLQLQQDALRAARGEREELRDELRMQEQRHLAIVDELRKSVTEFQTLLDVEREQTYALGEDKALLENEKARLEHELEVAKALQNDTAELLANERKELYELQNVHAELEAASARNGELAERLEKAREELAVTRELKDEMQNRYFEMEQRLDAVGSSSFLKDVAGRDSSALMKEFFAAGNLETEYNLPPTWFRQLMRRSQGGIALP